MSILIIGGALPVRAQNRVQTLDELRQALVPGDVITVGLVTGGSVTGRLLELRDNELGVRSPTKSVGGADHRLDLSIPIGEIQSVERPRDSSRDGALIGAAIGGGFALSLFIYALAVDRNEFDEWGPTYAGMIAAYTGIGALSGWAIDRAHSKPHIRFEAGTSSSALTRHLVRPNRAIAVRVFLPMGPSVR